LELPSSRHSLWSGQPGEDFISTHRPENSGPKASCHSFNQPVSTPAELAEVPWPSPKSIGLLRWTKLWLCSSQHGPDDKTPLWASVFLISKMGIVFDVFENQWQAESKGLCKPLPNCQFLEPKWWF
jgi:hypothetical protein